MASTITYPLPDLEPKAADSSSVRKLKHAALRMLQDLPKDYEFLDLAKRADHFAPFALRIKPKETEGGLAPFVFNSIQLDHLNRLRGRYRTQHGVDTFRGIRDLILKPRQLGFTTYIAALYFLDGLFFPGRLTLVMTHLQKICEGVLDKYRTFYECLPGDIKDSIKLRRASALHLELVFLNAAGDEDPIHKPSSGFQVWSAEAGGYRGGTPHNLHLSECAFYPDWQLIAASVLQALPLSGNCFIESTANGYNHFKDLVDGALEGKSAWNLIFYSWLKFPEYTILCTRVEADEIQRTMTDEERRLVLEQSATFGQLKWRRRKIDELKSLGTFKQEYPSTISEAFLASGTLRFATDVVTRNLEAAKKVSPLYTFDEGVEIYKEYDSREEYILCLDPAEGINRGEGNDADEIGGLDFSAGSVIGTRTLLTYATIHGRWEPAHFAAKAGRLGNYYDAMIACERNNHGHTVLQALQQAEYPNIYHHIEYDSAGNQISKPGFPTTSQTRNWLIDTLAEVIRRDALPALEWRFWFECMNFVRNPVGKCEASPGRHDDRVMSKAIGVYVATMGSFAWGGGNLVKGADSANLPKGGDAMEYIKPMAQPSNGGMVELPTTAIRPKFDETAAYRPKFNDDVAAIRPIISPEAQAAMEQNAIPAQERKDEFDFSTSGMMKQAGLDFGNTEATKQALFAIKDMRAAIKQLPKCEGCAHCIPQHGQFLCRANSFAVRPEDPACNYWDAKIDLEAEDW
jgi:hypothetical protein